MMYSSTAGTEISFECEGTASIPAKSSHARYVSTAKICIRSHVSVIHLSYFYRECGRVSDLVGSVKPGPNNISSSVIMAHWPSNGQLASDSFGLNVGEVQFYLKHSIKRSDPCSSSSIPSPINTQLLRMKTSCDSSSGKTRKKQLGAAAW